MAGQELKASEKKVMKMTKDGVAEKNLVTDKSERVSKKAEDAVLKKDATPVLLAKYKVTGLEKQTESKHQFRKLQFGKNNSENQRNEDKGDNQHSEQTLSASIPVVSISFVPKNDVSEFWTIVNKLDTKVRKLTG